MTQTSRIFAPLIALFLAAASPALAGEVGVSPPDQVVLDLAAEDWVETGTVRLMVRVAAAIAGDQVGALRGEIMKSLEQLAPGAKWHITGFHRSRNKAGLERTNVSAEARVKETAIGDVHDKARSLSRPGMQVTVAGMDFSPTLTEREAVAAGLRAQVYVRVREEMQRLNKVYEGRGFRLRLVDFADHMRGPEVRPMRAREMAADRVSPSPSQSFSPALNVSQRLVLRARVVLAAD